MAGQFPFPILTVITRFECLGLILKLISDRSNSFNPPQRSLDHLAVVKMPAIGQRLRRNINGRLGFASAVMMLSQINFGMDLVGFANTQAMGPFNKKFGHYDADLKRYAIAPYFLSLLNSLTYVGQVFGVLFGGWIARHYGRRVSFWIMSLWAVVAAILLVTAQTKEQVLAGRIINYIYLGQELVTVPVFQAEIAPPEIRGMVIGTFQLGTMVSAKSLDGELLPANVRCRLDRSSWHVLRSGPASSSPRRPSGFPLASSSSYPSLSRPALTL